MSEHIRAAEILKGAAGGRPPEVGMLLGSGLGEIADRINNPVTLSYADLPGFPAPTVRGHSGQLLIGDWNGRRIACMQGRFHLYEGHKPPTVAIPIRALKAAGCHSLVLTCAAGSLNPEVGPGSLVALNDHINWSGISPLIGPNDETIGPRFFDLSNTYDTALRGALHESAKELGQPLHEGVYLWALGPNFETPAEIEAFRRLGADLVGMSTVPEALAAVHCGLRVAAIAVVTNLAAGIQTTALSHEETLSAGTQAAPHLGELLDRLFGRLHHYPPQG